MIRLWGRRKLFALIGLGAGVAAKAGLGSGETAHASAPVVGMNGFAGGPDLMEDGVQGYAIGQNNAGTFGRNNDLNGVGVYGAAPNGTGVHGESAGGTGVGGRSTSKYGVYGVSTDAAAVYGHHSGSNVGGIGVSGDSTAGAGLQGVSTNYYGIYGYSANSIAVVGYTNHATSTSSTGVAGYTVKGCAVYGQANDPTGHAAIFAGAVQVQGSFTVTGSKSAAVPHPDGSHRRLYCVESPESLFEDSGIDQLVAGRAQVRFDPDFAAIVKTDAYQVFLTPEGDCRGLYVASKTSTGFEVRELQGGTNSLSFSYRVLAKRKDLASAPRLERVEMAPGRAAPRLTLPDEPPQTSAPSTRSTPAPPPSPGSTTAPATATPTAIPTSAASPIPTPLPPTRTT
jgi:hypothetical protein